MKNKIKNKIEKVTVMKYTIERKLDLLKFEYNIFDEGDKLQYKVLGEMLDFPRKYNIYDMSDEYKIHIEEDVFNLLPRYQIFKGEELLAVINRKLTLGTKLDVDSIYGMFKIKGEIFSLNYDIIKEDKIVAQINREMMALLSVYNARIEENENQEFILALIIIIDNINRRRRKARNRRI